MKTIVKISLMAIAYLASFMLGSVTGLIHPACYAYVGAILPLLTAFIYLYTCSLVKGFGAATILNGFVLFVLLISGEADIYCIIGLIGLTAIAPL